MNRRELVQAIATQCDVDKKTADKLVSGFTDVVTAVVSKGEPVTISGFAKFAKAERAARMGRNPATGEAIKIKASKKARITALKGFKDAVIKPSEAPKLMKGVWPPAPVAAKPVAKKAVAKTTTRATAKPAARTTKPAAKATTARKAAPAKRATAKR